MNHNRRARLYVFLMGFTSLGASGGAFYSLYRLRDDPLPALANMYELAAWLQPVPYLVALIGTVFLRQRSHLLPYVFWAVVSCGAFGWWWLDDLQAIRQTENEPVRRGALGNILPDIEGQAGAIGAVLWPGVVLAIVVGFTFIGWLSTRRQVRLPRRDDP